MAPAADGFAAGRPASGRQRSPAQLIDGCYLIDYTPAASGNVGYAGTLRVETSTGALIASGDLYQRPLDGSALAPLPDPAGGIPIFPVQSYRYYLRVIQALEAAAGFDLVFEILEAKPLTVPMPDGGVIKTFEFQPPAAFAARMAAGAGSNGSEQRFTGEVADSRGALAGKLSMVRVSSYLRKASIEMDRIPYSELPLDNGEGENWRTIFDKVGWEITLRISDGNVEDLGEFWSGPQAHATMLARRDSCDLDTEWRYYLLAVRRIVKMLDTTDPVLGERGYMFDEPANDIDHVPREGFMVASHWPIPRLPAWGLLQGKRAADTVTYFRTAVHEFGHATGLSHNPADNGFMNPTDGVAAKSTPENPFPTNLQWAFNPVDETRLRHWPDFVVRPGGNPGAGEGSPIPAMKSDQHRLDVVPDKMSVSPGAPVNLALTLTNISRGTASTPDDLGTASQFVRGQVVGPDGTVRSFAPQDVPPFQDPLPVLEPAQSFSGAFALQRSEGGGLFPLPGDYRILVDVIWRGDEITLFANGETRLTVEAS